MKQSDTEWDKKVTKRFLEAYLLRQEGQTKHLVCRYMFLRSTSVYTVGGSRCTECETKFSKFEDRCPCCNKPLRKSHRAKANSEFFIKKRDSLEY